MFNVSRPQPGSDCSNEHLENMLDVSYHARLLNKQLRKILNRKVEGNLRFLRRIRKEKTKF
jgi:hypothetical protein